MKPDDSQSNSAELAAAGQAAADIIDWLKAVPHGTTDYATDGPRYSALSQASNRLLGRLPPRPQRSSREHAAAPAILTRARQARPRILPADADAGCAPL